MNSAVEKATDTTPQYAQVAVPVHLAKTFTYRLPPSMQPVARVGSRVLVPLGTKPSTGYIVALLPRLRSGTSLVESEVKDVQQLLDVEPPLTPEVLEITRWVADYYAAPWGEVMRAALPAGINATVEQTVSITLAGRHQLAAFKEIEKTNASLRGLRLLADEGEFELNAFCLRLGAAKTPKWLRELEQRGLVQRSHRARSAATRVKRRRAVRLAKFSADDETAQEPEAQQHAAESLPKMRAGRPRSQGGTNAQHRAIEVLRENENSMAIADLIKAANVSESVIRTLRKKGVIDEFEQAVRRDPLARAELPGPEDFKLSVAQAGALHEIEKPMKQHCFAAFLLHGVTGSGKTEVYLQLIARAVDSHKQALLLVPEINLTPQLEGLVRTRFPRARIASLHSGLNEGERLHSWIAAQSGAANIILGTRLAVFTPMPSLGLIVVGTLILLIGLSTFASVSDQINALGFVGSCLLFLGGFLSIIGVVALD